MAADNSFQAIAEMVASTVENDPDLVYGIFMDPRRQPWVVADSSNRSGRVHEARTLDDSVSRWAAGVEEGAHRLFVLEAGEVYEFAAPVLIEGERGGTIRYGLSTDRMNAAIAKASVLSRQALYRTIGSVILVGLLAVFMAFLAARKLADRLTRPIRGLQIAANAIAKGEYQLQVDLQGTDEIALLVADFDSMRLRIKDYTERLHKMVEEKVREIRDILDNVGQGLFTLTYEGRINPDYASTTNDILDVQDVALSTVQELFRLDESGLENWREWLGLVHARQGRMPWSQLARLCPVQELHLPGPNGSPRYVQVRTQPMLDGHGRPGKLMVLVQDVTESRRIEAILRGERERHEDHVKAILAIVNNAAVLPYFFRDVDAKYDRLLDSCRAWREGRMPAEGRAGILRDLHTLKGTAASYGLGGLERGSRQVEVAAEGALMEPAGPDAGGLHKLAVLLEQDLRSAIEDVKALWRRLSGLGDDPMITVPERKVQSLKALAEEAMARNKAVPAEMFDRLMASCRSLDHVSLAVLGDRYRSMLSRLGSRLGKSIDFRFRSGLQDISPRAIAVLDEPLVHLLRNAVDHGIEEKKDRVAAGKGDSGLIELALEPIPGGIEVTVEDDGNGVDVPRVVGKALTIGAARPDQIAAMSDGEKARLIFSPGLSTSGRKDDISGMGVGMDAVAAWIDALGGNHQPVQSAGQGHTDRNAHPRRLRHRDVRPLLPLAVLAIAPSGIGDRTMHPESFALRERGMVELT